MVRQLRHGIGSYVTVFFFFLQDNLTQIGPVPDYEQYTSQIVNSKIFALIIYQETYGTDDFFDLTVAISVRSRGLVLLP